MHFRQKKVFLDHVFFFFNGKPGHRGPTHPILMENSINFFFFLNLPLANIFEYSFGPLNDIRLLEHYYKVTQRYIIFHYSIVSTIEGFFPFNSNFKPPDQPICLPYTSHSTSIVTFFGIKNTKHSVLYLISYESSLIKYTFSQFSSCSCSYDPESEKAF